MIESREPFYGPLFGIFQLGLVVSIVPGIPKALQYAFFSILLWIGHYLVTKTTTGNPAVNLAQGSAIATQLMTAFDIIFITHPDSLKDIYHKQTGKITNAPLKQRVKWALNLYTNARGIGWTHEAHYTPPRVTPGTSRWAFVFRQLRRCMLCMALESAIYLLNASNPFMTTNKLALTKAPFIWRALGVAGFAGGGYARINWMNCLLSAVAVGAGFSEPWRWPNLFGSLSDAWTVKRVWRYVWHHLLRKPIKALATFFIASIFRLPSQSTSQPSALVGTGHKFLWLCTAFFISGTVHIAGERMFTGRVGYGAFTFFMLQPLGIAIETLVGFIWNSHISSSSALPKKHTEEDCSHFSGNNGSVAYSLSSSPNGKPPALWIKCMGYIWVAIWFIWSLAFMIDPMVRMGMFVDPRVDVRNWGVFSIE